MRPTLAFDMEVYPNYTLLLFKHVETKVVTRFELPLDDFDQEHLRQLIQQHRLITFNGIGYDIPLLMLVLRGEPKLAIKKASDRIIVHHLKPWNFEREFHVSLTPPELDHVDLMEVAPLTGSLKLYGGRLHSYSLQDLPIEPNTMVNEDQKAILRRYCENDCDTLTDLYRALKEPLALREAMSKDYGIDLRSKSDAQIAEAVIKKEVEARLGRRIEKPGMGPGDKFGYTVPSWMRCTTTNIVDLVALTRFSVSDKGKVLMPKSLASKDIVIAGKSYRMGIGGLHSCEKKQVKVANAQMSILDFDVTGYYPNLILTLGLSPRHIGEDFIEVYRSLVERRIRAKKAGQKSISESLKIVSNGTYGKLGSKWSVLYSPDLMIQVTITGQIAILMLIEFFADIVGVEVISANTDGVTITCQQGCEAEVLEVVASWQKTTGLELERADYSGLYSRDVNNYIAVQTDGVVKAKGVYGTGLPLHKNPNAQICAKAVIAHLTHGTPIEETVGTCSDIRKFVTIHQATGGALYHDTRLGKVVRWYYSTLEDQALLYRVNRYLVPKSLHAVPLIEMPDRIPVDLDRGWYITEANAMLAKLGVV